MYISICFCVYDLRHWFYLLSKGSVLSGNTIIGLLLFSCISLSWILKQWFGVFSIVTTSMFEVPLERSSTSFTLDDSSSELPSTFFLYRSRFKYTLIQNNEGKKSCNVFRSIYMEEIESDYFICRVSKTKKQADLQLILLLLEIKTDLFSMRQ